MSIAGRTPEGQTPPAVRGWCVRAWMRRLCLLLALLPMLASAQTRTVGQIIDGVRQHGYNSPSRLIEEMQAAPDRPRADAPAEDQRVYHAALGQYALAAGDQATLFRAIHALEVAAKPRNCNACAAQALVLRAGWDLSHAGAAPALERLDLAGAMLGPQAPPDARAHLLAVRAETYRSSARYAHAVRDALAAIRLADQRDDTALEVEMNVTLGLANAGLEDFSRVDGYFNTAIETASRIGYGYQMANAHFGMAHAYALRKSRSSQRRALLATLELTDRQPDLAGVRVKALANLADYHLGNGEYPQALGYAVQAEQLARNADRQRTLAIALGNKGIALAHLGQVDAGVQSMKDGLAIVRRLNAREHLIGMMHELVGIHEHAGQYREAVAVLHQTVELERERSSDKRSRDVVELQEEFASERQAREIERLKAVNERQAALVRARTAQRWMWLMGVVALAFAAAILFRRLRRVGLVNASLRRTNRELEVETFRDPLTGIYNRRQFQHLVQKAEQAQAMAGRSAGMRLPQPSLSLIVLDLDYFKKVNDRLGHEAGDAVLVDIARRLCEMVRKDDAVIRWGGEEFVLVLPGTNAEGACTLMKRVLEAVGSAPIHHAGHAINVTASAGCVTLPETGVDAWNAALTIADSALYLSKAIGRNRGICVSGMQSAGLPKEGLDLLGAEARGEVRLQRIAGPVVSA